MAFSWKSVAVLLLLVVAAGDFLEQQPCLVKHCGYCHTLSARMAHNLVSTQQAAPCMHAAAASTLTFCCYSPG